ESRAYNLYAQKMRRLVEELPQVAAYGRAKRDAPDQRYLQKAYDARSKRRTAYGRFGYESERGRNRACRGQSFKQSGDDQQPDHNRHRSQLHSDKAKRRAENDEDLSAVAVAQGSENERTEQLGYKKRGRDESCQSVR